MRMRAFVSTVVLFMLFAPALTKAQAPTPPNVPTLGPPVFYSVGGNQASVNILSPPNNQSYLGNTIQLNFTAQSLGMFGQFGNVGYRLDGGTIYSVSNFVNMSVDHPADAPDWYWNRTTAFASVVLPNLSDGVHNITAYFGWQYLGTNNPSLERYEVAAYASAIFRIGPIPTPSVSWYPIGEETGTLTVDYTPPVLHVIQPEKKTYEGSDVQLNFTVDEPVSWMGYCLDMATANVTIDGNTTLSGLLTPSSHILQVFANDSMGNMGESDIIGFVTTNPPVSPLPVVTQTQTAAHTTPPATTPSPSPTQQPTPSLTPILISPNYEDTLNNLQLIFGAIALAVSVTVVVVVILIKRRRFTQ